MTAVSLYFLIQVLGCQLGSAQIKDIHPQSVLSSHQWHALVFPPLATPLLLTHIQVHTMEVFHYELMMFSFFPRRPAPKPFFSPSYRCLLSDSDLFSTVRANSAPLSHSLTGWRSEQKDSAVVNGPRGVSPKLNSEQSLRWLVKETLETQRAQHAFSLWGDRNDKLVGGCVHGQEEQQREVASNKEVNELVNKTPRGRRSFPTSNWPAFIQQQLPRSHTVFIWSCVVMETPSNCSHPQCIEQSNHLK